MFTLWRLPIHEHEITFHLFVPSSLSFISVLQFLMYRSVTSLNLFLSILLFLMLNRIIFSFSNGSLLVYVSTIDFCMWIWYTELY